MMKNILNINDRILYIIENQFNGNKKKFAEKIGFAPQVISNIVSGRKSKPSYDVLEAIITSFVYISPEWLLTGNGDMLRDKSTVVSKPVATYRKTKDGIKEQQNIPLFNLEATMGLIPYENGNGLDNNKIDDYLSIPDLPEADGAMRASGDSMYPLLKSGDIIVYKTIPIDRNYIYFGEIYVLAIYLDETTTMKTIKFVQPSELGDEYVKLVSHNQHHAEKNIKLNQIAAMALVRASIRIHN